MVSVVVDAVGEAISIAIVVDLAMEVNVVIVIFVMIGDKYVEISVFLVIGFILYAAIDAGDDEICCIMQDDSMRMGLICVVFDDGCC